MPGEVFGFLGTNGAGKTTTISILCQEFLPTSGSAAICGYDVVEEGKEALQCIGYCPQFDATLDLLTVEEHLRLYCGIHGIVEDMHESVVEALLQLCDVAKYRKTLAHELSGGNRRKLSVAISLVGGPRVVLLDEPSAGMDPVARRGLWTTIQKAASYCSVVLTTHNLEEVEALADTVAIMVDGSLRCIGDKVHLKNKYGSGYEMHIRIARAEAGEAIERFVNDVFPGATLNEFRGHRFVYALPRDTALSDAFRILQMNKEALGITDYSVSQTSIEQVFLRVSGEEV
ncbi:putative ATP-binding cassette transporter ABCA1 [Trypanosoma grayi]|uniref:putative ATP-binding cassette transporter ABCA1 n=1 Tax=Trypanosoma grayi TaxID=71804 RepID=UPI0004F42C8C|nr:putative ATP-binding cassette transporter ABCA1 [Trypanosoma grayi]KEG07296.1 putative ATP-binding cassette transporter ABCA1 [Trypanosoma grayi]